VDAVEERIVARRPTFAVAINPEKIYRARQDPRLLAVLQDATFGLCDGIGVAVAGLLLHRHLLQRCTGCDFFFRMTERAALRGWGVFLLGASAEANERAAAKLTERYPGLRIVGRRDGFFSDSAAVVREINESGADLLFVAMGSPKQELWLAEQRASLQAPFCMGVGGSFDVAGGLARRAPKFFQKTGTEYLFQLVTRPGWKTGVKWERTLARLKFMLTVARVACGGRAGRSERRAIPVEVLREPPAGAGIFQESAAEGRAEVRGRDV